MYLIISDNQKQLWWYGDIQLNVNKYLNINQRILKEHNYTCTCYDKSLKLHRKERKISGCIRASILCLNFAYTSNERK